MGSGDGSMATFDFPEDKVKANHPKEVRRKEGAILSVWRWKRYHRGREVAGRETLQ